MCCGFAFRCQSLWPRAFVTASLRIIPHEKLSVTQQLSDQAQLALDLAQTRYNLGLSSIVELSQAQLQQTQAQISNAQAGYDYRLALAILNFQTTGI